MLKNLFREKTPPARAPDGVRLYAIGDIHGCAGLLDRLLEKISQEERAHGGAARLIFLGDYVDRGPDSRGVLDRLIDVARRRPDTVFLKGNHEAVLLDFLADPEAASDWLSWGGVETLKSYGVRDAATAGAGGQWRAVEVAGNHEFDEGKDELFRLLNGGNHPTGPFLENPYRGSRYPTVSSNVVEEKTGKPILPPFVIKQVNGVRLAFIGAVLKQTPTIVTPTGVAGLTFLDEADSINRYVSRLRREEGIHTFIVVIHQGGTQTSYQGPTQPGGLINGQDIVDIVSRLDDDVDVIVSGHAHSFTNTLLKNRNGAEILVTQAFSSSTAYGDIDLTIDRRTGDVLAKSAAMLRALETAEAGL